MTSKHNAVFDPYVKWLGIRSPDRPPNHYALLGLTLFESDEDVIAAAAERQMAHVRKYQNGPHSAESQKILNELAAAKLCLLRTDQKAAYDQDVKEWLAAGATGQGSDLISANEVRRPRWTLRVALGVTVLMTLAGILWFAWPSRRVDERGVDRGALVSIEQASRQAAEILGDASEAQVEVVDVQPTGTKESHISTVDESKAVDPDSVKAESAPWELLHERRTPTRPTDRPGHPQAVAIWQALYDRDTSRARKALATMRKGAKDTEQRATAERFNRWLFLVNRFWDAVDEAVADPTLRGARISYRDRPVIVSDVSEGEITLESVSGMTKTFTTDRATIDLDLASGLVRRRLGATSPTADLLVGVVMSKDKQGDLTLAKKLLEAAQSRGEPIEALFDPELIYSAAAKPQAVSVPADDAVAASGTAISRTPVAPLPVTDDFPKETMTSAEVKTASAIESTDSNDAIPAAGAEEVASRPPGRQPIPAEQDRQLAQERVRELFADEYGKAKKRTEEMLSLGSQLLNHANRTSDDPTAKFVLYEEARRLAIEGRSPQLAAHALDALAHNFDVDTWALRLELVSACVTKSRDPAEQLFLLNQCRRATDHFLSNDDFESIEPFSVLIKRIGRATREPALKVYTRNIRSFLADVRRWHARVQPSFTILVDRPEDPDANQSVGEYICFGRQQFELGLPYLAEGSEPRLRELAKQELGGSQALAVTADAWWRMAPDGKEPRGQAIRRHAVTLYARALPQLSGLTFENAEYRILAQQISLVDGQLALSSLAETKWNVLWPGKEAWNSVHFRSGGDVIVDSKGPTWHGRAHEIDGTVRFMSSDNRTLFLMVVRDNQLLIQEFELETGYLVAVGLGSPLKPRVRNSS